MNNIAFLIPVYPPHYKFARDLIKSHQDCFLEEQSDIWFVFTNEAEQLEFGNWENSVILPEELRNFGNNGIINIKKFYALYQLKDKYKYIIVLDAESVFIRNINLNKICDEYFENKILYGNTQPPEGLERTENIKNTCKRYFKNHPNINKLNNPLYLWFNQPCIYKTSTLNEFFEVINYAQNAANFVWADFDYYIYMFYLMLYQNFEIEDIEITSNYGICEAGMDFLYFKSNKYEKINIYMCSQAVFKRFDNPKLFLLIHLDRDERWMISVFGIKIDNLTQEVKNLEKVLSKKGIFMPKQNGLEEINNNQGLPKGFKEYQKLNMKFKKHLSYFITPFKKVFTWLWQPIPILYNFIKLLFNIYFIQRLLSCFILDKQKRRKFRGDI